MWIDSSVCILYQLRDLWVFRAEDEEKRERDYMAFSWFYVLLSRAPYLW